MRDQERIRLIGTCHTCILPVGECVKPKMRDINPMEGCADWDNGRVKDIDPADIITVDQAFDPFADSVTVPLRKSTWQGS